MLALALALLMPVIAGAAPYADFVMDARTGQVLRAVNADTRLHPASLTKMMTLYIAFEAIEHGEISLDSKITVTKKAAAQAPSRLGLRPGQKIALRYLIRAAAIKSANDAAMAIAEGISGSQEAFAQRMNRTARALGMTRTNFVNPNGLTAQGHLSTARDMSILGRHVFYDYPQYYSIFSRLSADAGIAKVASTNRKFLSAYKGADGIKTGYTSKAGFNLVASAQRGNERIIATVFGGTSTAMRNQRMAELLDFGFAKAPTRVAVQAPARPPYRGGARRVASADDAEPVSYEDKENVAAAVASAMAAAQSSEEPEDEVDMSPNSTGIAAGKTLRVATAVARSQRPRNRPAPAENLPSDEVMVAMQNDINAALAEAQVAETQVAAAAEAPAQTLAIASAVPLPELAQNAPAARPAQAEAAPETAPETPAVIVADAAGSLAPAPRPETALSASAASLPQDDNAVAEPVALASVAGLSAAPQPAAAPPALPSQEVVVSAGAATPAPKARPEQVVLASFTPQPAAEEEREVVTRVSTSGGRQWAINVGHFGSRYNAERQLLKTALVEMNTLDEALRKVVGRKGGFDANFVGMTRDMAELACRRLQARQAECTVVGP